MMHARRLLTIAAALAMLVPQFARAEGGSKADYDRSAHLEELTANHLPQANIRPRWSPDSTQLWYAIQAKDKRTYITINATTGERHESDTRPDFNAASATAASEPATHPSTTPAASQPAETADNDSPDGHWRIVVRRHNLTLVNLQSHDSQPLTQDADADDFYNERDIAWSPDSTRFVAIKTKAGQKHTVYEIESSPTDQVQPKLHSFDYLKPGDKIPLRKPHLFLIADKKEITIPDTLFPNPWSLDDIRWDADSSRFTFLYNQRGHQTLRLLACDAKTGDVKPVINEESKTFIDYNDKFFIHYIPDTHEIIWMSERDGWNHLYLIDSQTGEVKNQITKGNWVVRGVDTVDSEKREITFHCGGIDPAHDPYYVQYCRINFDGTHLIHLTTANGTHKIAYSPDHQFYLDTYSRADLPPTTELHRTTDGSLVCPLEKPTLDPLLATSWRTPEQFVAKGRDGTTDIYGIIYRPTNFDPAKKYPVIENIYAGPQDSFVPKAFERLNDKMRLAELGFIVVQIDGMGTSNRSKAFHDVCWHNLGDAGFPDRIAWIKAAAEKDPSMDLTRVGIYGGSAGGQNALRALEAHGDFYKVAIADCGCHDNRMDKIWWNELWMGYPIGPWYAEQSNVTNAKNMNGKLLLIVGELDTNVDPASTMQVVNALIKANKDFDLLVVPGSNHGASENPYGKRRREDFFVRNLLHVEPRHD